MKCNCPVCGKRKSNRGRKFNSETLERHIQDAHPGWQEGDPTFELTDMIADDDMPDGAYFAMAWELGELW